MIIRRIEVEGGFLDGLNLALEPGLVTVIGPRGTGKTSMIELIRFALDTGRLTKAADPYKHAHAILDSGQVTLTVEVEGEEVRVVRASSDVAPRGLDLIRGAPPLILAQNEIEVIGEERSAQLSLIDGFRPESLPHQFEEARLHTALRSATESVQLARNELASLSDELVQVGDISQARQEAAVLQASLSLDAEKTQPIREQLESLDGQLSAAKIVNEILRRNLQLAEGWLDDLKAAALREPQLHQVPIQAASDGLDERVAEARAALDTAVSSVARGVASARLALTSTTAKETSFESAARDLRRQLEDHEEGAGAAAKAISAVQQREAYANSLRGLIGQGQEDLSNKQASRADLIEELEVLHQQRYEQRAAIVAELNARLSPKISAALTRSGNFDAYTAALIQLLKGSNLRYNTLAPALAAQVSPVELALLSEAGDASRLAEATGLDLDRAGRVIGYIGAAGTHELLTVPIEDSVELSLLDGQRYKSSDELSTGQRCTVVLPILLSQPGRNLVIDQPEDHLDNEFIVETVIHALKARSPNVQIILSTHNANIPVLGEANQVVALHSNGQRGFVRRSGSLDDDDIVKLITAVMEGGADAFNRRADFYSAHGAAG